MAEVTLIVTTAFSILVFCIIQSLLSRVKQQRVTLSILLAVVVYPLLQFCSPELKLFNVISVYGLSLQKETEQKA